MKYKLENICLKITDGSHYSPSDDKTSDIPMFSVKDMEEFNFNYSNCKHISKEEYIKMLKNDCVPKLYDVLVAKDGSYLKEIFVNETEDSKAILSSIAIFRPNLQIINPYFLCYLLKNPMILNYVKDNCVSGSALPRIILRAFKGIELEIPALNTQNKIVRIIKNINDRIRLNNETNNNLSEQIKYIYNDIFIDYADYKRLDEISNVTIGKTPPRSEQECFTTNKNDVKWVSISDLGKSGMFIFDTSEKLTQEAVDKYNVKVIPKDTVILSFKLTVGRTGFTTEDMTTNEAIAHFDLNNKELNNYLYCTLTYFNYSDLGSTSSIATAINSKIVKSIKIGIPSDEQLNKFNNLTSAMFKTIKNNESENIKLSDLRDTLLPKLMNGEIDLDNIEI